MKGKLRFQGSKKLKNHRIRPSIDTSPPSVAWQFWWLRHVFRKPNTGNNTTGTSCYHRKYAREVRYQFSRVLTLQHNEKSISTQGREKIDHNLKTNTVGIFQQKSDSNCLPSVTSIAKRHPDSKRPKAMSKWINSVLGQQKSMKYHW